jgi:hypothetical protein
VADLVVVVGGMLRGRGYGSGQKAESTSFSSVQWVESCNGADPGSLGSSSSK